MLEALVADGALTLRADGGELLRATSNALLTNGHVANVEIAVETVEAGAIVRLRFRNTTGTALHLEQLRLEARDGFRGAQLGDVRIHQTGWQSWSRAHPSDVFEA